MARKTLTAIIYEKTPDGKGGFHMKPVTSTSVLTVSMSASILGVGYNTVQRLCDNNILPHERPSPGRITISLEDLMEYKNNIRDPEFYERNMKHKNGQTKQVKS